VGRTYGVEVLFVGIADIEVGQQRVVDIVEYIEAEQLVADIVVGYIVVVGIEVVDIEIVGIETVDIVVVGIEVVDIVVPGNWESCIVAKVGIVEQVGLELEQLELGEDDHQ